MKALITNRYAVLIVRWLLGAVFIASALGKIMDPSGFADNVAAYRLLPIYSVNVFALVLPWVELLVGFSLINGVASRSGALLATIMNVVFIGSAAARHGSRAGHQLRLLHGGKEQGGLGTDSPRYGIPSDGAAGAAQPRSGFLRP